MSIVNLQGYTFSESFRQVLDDLNNFEVYDDDIWICSFPKTGTTWTQEMMWLIIHDLDFQRAQVDNEIRMPYVEMTGLVPLEVQNSIKIEPDYLANSIEFAKNARRPRLLKSHVPFELLPRQIQTFERKPKIIYVYRNMKDTCVSYYHYFKLLGIYNLPFDNYWKLFIEGKLLFTPMIDSVKSYWKHKGNKHFHFVRYEDMKADLHTVILDACKFLNKSFSEEDISKLMEHLSFENMKTNPFVDKHILHNFCHSLSGQNQDKHFFRQGKVGSYRSEITPEIESVFDEHLKKQLRDTDLKL